MGDLQVHVVIDNGTAFMKAGFSGEEAPRTVFPTLVGTPSKVDQTLKNIDKKEKFFGQESLQKLGINNSSHPIEDGSIKNWDEMELLWHHTLYNELRIVPEEHNIILTDSPLNSKENREKMCEIMFEKFLTPGLFICSTSVMSTYSTGRTIGMVIDSGETVTNYVPVYEGFAFDHATIKSKIGGRDLTDYMIKLILDRKVNIDTSQKKLIINDAKERFCSVSLDYETDKKEDFSNNESTIVLPDGEKINIDYEKIRVPECLFNPKMLEKDIKGLHDDCYKAIQQTDVEIRKDLYSNIILAGGNTLFQGFPERVTWEIQKLTPGAAANKVKIIALPERKYAAWIGTSIFSALSSFQCLWITKDEYLEGNGNGKDIIHKKCF